MKILIAEDDQDIALFYKVLLEARNHHVISTDNGEDCLTIYRQEFGNFASRIGSIASDNRLQQQQAFDTVLLDYKMPKINGIEVAKEIVKINPKQRIIISSAHSREFLFHSKKELEKPVEFVQKPFDLQTFIDTLENQLFYSRLQRLNQDEVITQELEREVPRKFESPTPQYFHIETWPCRTVGLLSHSS
jgi:DNA-binding NtrC family response regulator